MLTYIHSAKCVGVQAVDVIVEVDISSGIGIHLVGLADAAVKESLLRTITALTSLGFRVPGKKIVINLAPADIRKNGSGYDVPIAIGILAASGQIDAGQLEDYIIMGELGLDGSVRAVPGALPIAGLVESRGMKGCILPLDAAGLCRDYYPDTVYAVDNLLEVIRILDGQSDSSGLLVKNRSCGSRSCSGSRHYSQSRSRFCAGKCSGRNRLRQDCRSGHRQGRYNSGRGRCRSNGRFR